MDIVAALVADGQTPIAGEPGQGALNDPAMPSELLAGLDALASDAAANAMPVEVAAAAGGVVRLVSMQLQRTLARAARSAARAEDRRDAVDQRREEARVVGVRGREADDQGDAPAVDHKMALRARFAAIRRIRPGLIAPLFAGTLAESKLARDQSIRSASPSQSSKSRWSFCQTPAFCQATSRRQQVEPLPQPNSAGSRLHGSPVFSTKMIPVRQARSGTRGRPPFGFAGSSGRSGSTARQRSSDTSCLLMPPHVQAARHGIETRSK
jgi:hypothetical protein